LSEKERHNKDGSLSIVGVKKNRIKLTYGTSAGTPYAGFVITASHKDTAVSSGASIHDRAIPLANCV